MTPANYGVNKAGRAGGRRLVMGKSQGVLIESGIGWRDQLSMARMRSISSWSRPLLATIWGFERTCGPP